ncbi:interleukin-1 receptor type 2 [Trichomycterus rosablanca]|uniref:interleukin-1 receptor type 2 n=1 Tax=Trichomycterus rosablanca TaxID=2290929 RepID=UPI002F35D6A6
MVTFIGQCLGSIVWMVLSVCFVPAYMLPVKDTCEVLGEELQDFHAQGEAVAISFPFLETVISTRKLPVDNTTTFQLFRNDLRDIKNQRQRVVQKGRMLWLLPSLPSDTGTYTYVFSSDMYCITGNISETIYETGREDMEMMSHPVSARPNRDLTIRCPHLDHFNRAESPRWYKGYRSGVPLIGSHYSTERELSFTIKNISTQDQGLYTCRLKVIINSTQYNVSRTWKLRVLAPPPRISDRRQMEPSIIFRDDASKSSTLHCPYITAPVNGSTIESHLGSSLVIQCKVSVGSNSPSFTNLTWLVNGQPVESSYLNGRAYQSARRMEGGNLELHLVFLEVHEEDVRAELACASQNLLGSQKVFVQIKLEESMCAWMVVGAVSSCFFLLVVFVFLRLLCSKQQKQNDYILARQNSSF